MLGRDDVGQKYSAEVDRNRNEIPLELTHFMSIVTKRELRFDWESLKVVE